MSIYLCPSMMCADFGCLKDEVEKLEAAGADILHIDIMDGQYVENLAMGFQDVAFIRKATKLPIEIHLMVMNPDKLVNKFLALGVDILYFHPETVYHPARIIERINDHGAKAGIVLNPETSIETVSQLMYIIDYVMLMTVNPGFAGLKYLNYVEDKIYKLCAIKEIYNIEISMDGAITKDIIQKFIPAGVNRYVLGTTALFSGNKSYTEKISELRCL